MKWSKSGLEHGETAARRTLQFVLSKLLPLMALAALALGDGCGGSGSSSSGSTPNPVTVTISPLQASLLPSGTKTFSAVVNGDTNQGINWACSGGTIDQLGNYTAPAKQGTYSVTATSIDKPTAFASAQVTVAPANSVQVSIAPTNPMVGVGGQVQFTATVTGSTNTAVTWTTNSGTVSTTGLYTAPAMGGVYRVTATSVASPSSSGTVSVTVTGPSVVISPALPSLGTNETVQLTATTYNLPSQAVTWNATGGTVSSGGLFHAGETAGTFSVTATSVSNPQISATVPITVKAITVTVIPSVATIVFGQTQQFTARLTGPAPNGVTWKATGGTITSEGLFTAPGTATTVTVTATSVDDPNVSGTSTVTVTSSSSFFYDFNNGIPPVWTPSTNENTPSGIPFLGRISGTNAAQLSLGNLTPHSTITVTFDLFVIGAWGGIPSSSTLTVNIGGTGAFSQSFSNQQSILQSYPLSGSNAPGTGSTAQNSLGYTSVPAILYNDTTYHITCTAAHTASSVTILFTGNLTGTVSQMAWGLKNVSVVCNP